MPCGRPGGIGGAPPPGLVGTAGAGRPVLGGGGGTREPPEEPKEPSERQAKIKKQHKQIFRLFFFFQNSLL